MREFITENLVYIASAIWFTLGWIIGKSNGKAQAYQAMNAQRMRTEMEQAWQQQMEQMKRGFSHE